MLAEAADMSNQRVGDGDAAQGLGSAWEAGKWKTRAGEAAAIASGGVGDSGAANAIAASAGSIVSRDWVTTRDVTERSMQPLLLSTSTATPILFKVPPLLRWLEQLGLAQEVARMYYTTFREGGCGELFDLFRLTSKKTGGGLCAKFPQLQNESHDVRKMMRSLHSPPRLVRYSTDPAICEVGCRIQPMYPILDCENAGAAVSFSALLPPGLVLDQASGSISGTPTTEVTETAFTVVVTNPVGSCRYDFAITIEEEQPF
jgi:hypothetical protein